MARGAVRTPVILLAVVVALIVAGLLYWQLEPWASNTEKARLEGLRVRVAGFYKTHPPSPEWHILSIEVARPGIVVSLDMPAKTAEALERRGAVYRLEAAGAICPEPDNSIYRDLGRFELVIRPQADGKPVLVEADCRKVRIPESRS